MSKWPFTHRARVLLIADPDADPALLRLAQDLLVTGGTGPEGFETTGPQSHLEAQLAAHLGRVDIDGLVVLRTERHPCREVQTAVALARARGKPVHVLVVAGITPAIEADESHPIALDPTDETRPSDEFRQDLYQWGSTFAQRFGHKM
jgi:hypothetical protein